MHSPRVASRQRVAGPNDACLVLAGTRASPIVPGTFPGAEIQRPGLSAGQGRYSEVWCAGKSGRQLVDDP